MQAGRRFQEKGYCKKGNEDRGGRSGKTRQRNRVDRILMTRYKCHGKERTPNKREITLPSCRRHFLFSFKFYLYVVYFMMKYIEELKKGNRYV